MPAPAPYLGELEQVVLLAVVHLGEEAYGVPILDFVRHRARRRLARGALYTVLARLEDKGCLRSRLGEPVEERGGRPRRYYSTTAAGFAALGRSRRTLIDLWSGLESRLEKS
jgi:DNA-binding PadR family transcriptional regulator